MAIYYYNRCIDQDEADTNETWKAEHRTFTMPEHPTEPVYQMRYGAKRQTVFQMFHVKQEFFTERSCTVAIFPCMC